MDEEDVLLKLLNDNPDPPVFCFHKELLGSVHQCSSPNNMEHCRTSTVLAMSTPVQLKKVFSPRNLELDSDTSSVMAGWSFSMATPTCPWVDAGKNPMAHNSSISTTDEGSSSLSTESGCGLEMESPPVRDKGDEDDKSLLKIRNKTIFSKQKPVPRTLFPPKTTPLKAINNQQRCVLEPSNYLSPIPPAMSPLVCTSHHAQSKTPLKHQLNNSIASTSLFETPIKEPITTSHCSSDPPHNASSQDMFGSPEIFTPCLDIATVETKESIQAEGNRDVVEEEPEDVCSKEGCAADSSNENQSLNKSLSNAIPLEDLHNLSPSPDHKPSTCNPANIQPIIHSTPLYSCNHNTEIVHPPLPNTTCQTPAVPVEHAHEPSPHVNELIITPQDHEVCVPVTPVKGETNESTKVSYNFGSTDNVLDFLFMSPPELDRYLSKDRRGTTIFETHPSNSSTEDVIKRSKKEVVTIPSTQQGALHEANTSSAVVSDIEEMALCGCEVAEPIPNPVDTEAMDIQEPTDKQSDLKPHEPDSDAWKTNSTLDAKLSEPALELQPPLKRLKGKATASFLYPGSRRLTVTKKRTRYTCIAKKTDLQIPHKHTPVDTCAVEEKANHISMDHSDNDEEPPRKKAHIENQDNDDDVTKIDESMIEHSSQNEMQDTGLQQVLVSSEVEGKIPATCISQVEEDSNTKECADNAATLNCDFEAKHSEVHDNNVGMNSHCPDECNNDTGLASLNDVPQPLPSHPGGEIHTHSSESVIKSSSVRKLRTPGLSRRHPVTRKLNLPQETIREERCASPKETHSIETKEMQVPPHADPIARPVLEKCPAAVPTAFAGFSTAAGSSISISNEAIEKAKSLLSGELEWKDDELSEQPRNQSSLVSMSLPIQTASALADTPCTSVSVSSPGIVVEPMESSKHTSLSAFKTPLHVRSKLSHPASVPNRTNVLSRTTKRPASTFKAPRKAESVSKAEEKASVARILRGFRASGAGPSGSSKRDPVEMKVESNPKRLMVSGFSTAAGSKLTVSSESMKKAQQLLMSDKENGMIDELQKPETALPTAIVRPTEMTGFKTASGKGLSVSASAMEKAKQIVNSIEQDTDVDKVENDIPARDGEVLHVTVGFQTAAGKSLCVSSKALLKAESAFSSVSEDSTCNTEVEAKPDIQSSCGIMLQTGFQTAGGTHISVSSKSLDKAQTIVDEEKSDLLESHSVNLARCLTGFSTASGSTISISKTSLVKAQSDMEGEVGTIQNKEPCLRNTESVEDVSMPRHAKEPLDCSLTVEDVDTLNCFTQVNFRKSNSSETIPESQSNHPADNATIHLNDEDLKDVVPDIKDDQHNLSLDPEDSHSHYFSTQMVKQLLEFSSDEEMSTSDDKDQATEANGEDNTIVSSFQENVQNVESVNDDPLDNESSLVSSQAPVVSHNETQDTYIDPSVVQNHTNSMEPPQSANPVDFMMEEATVENDESVLNNEEEMLTESMVESMNISAVAASCSDEFAGLLESRSNTNQHQAACTSGLPGLQTASGKEVNICQESLEAARIVFSDRHPTREFPGLQTASGIPVDISNESLQAARATLDSSIPVPHSSRFPGLQTASGTHVSISKAALEAAKATLDSKPSMPQSSGFPGLQTASGMKVSISKESLEAARSVLDGDKNRTPFDKLTHLQTTGETEMSICKEPLKATQATFDSGSNMPQSSKFPGLQTASGNKVSISKESLEAAKAILDEKTSAPTNYGFPGLQTAGGNKVNISKESLDAARSVLNSDTNTLSTGGSGFSGLQTASGAQVNISKESLDAAKASLNKDTNSSFSGLQTARGTKVSISRESLEAARNVLGNVETLSHGFSTIDSEDDSHTGAPNCPPRTPQPCCRSQQTPRRNSLHSDSTRPVDDGKYRPIFTAASMNRGRFHVPTSDNSGSFSRELSRGESSVKQNITHQSQPVKSTRGVISTPEATLCDRANNPKRRPLLPSQSHLKPGSNPRHSYPHSVVPYSSYSSIHRQPSNVFKTPHRPSGGSMRVQQDTGQTSFSSPQLAGNLSRNVSTDFTPSANQPVPPAYTNKSFSHSKAVAGGQTDRYSTCTPVWKASLNKKIPSNITHSGHRNHRRSIVFTPVQKKPTGDHIVTSTHPSHQHTSVTPSFSNTTIHQTTPSFQHLKLTDNVPSTVVDHMNLRTSTQVNPTTHNTDCDLSIPLSPLHVTLSQLNAMDDPDMETQNAVGGKSKATNDSGYVSRETSTTKSPSPGTEHENCRLSTDASKQKEVCADKDSITMVSTDDAAKTCEIDGMVFAEVAKEQLNDSLEVDDTELPEDVLYNKSISTDHRNQCSTSTTTFTTTGSKYPSIKKHPTMCTSSMDSAAIKTYPTNGAIKPMTGSLLATRDEYKSSRIPLQSAVRGQPPGSYTQSELHGFGVHGNVMSVTASNSEDFCFSGSHYFSSSVLSGSPVCVGDGAMLTLSNGSAGLHQFWEAFRVSPGVDQCLISLKWFTNHYKQLVWKLTSMECSYPHLFAGRCLTPDWLMIQMKYRYDREIDRAQRPALRKICEQDDVASRRMVLCVSHIHTENLQHVHQAHNASGNKTQSMESGNETILAQNDTINEDGVSSTENANPPCIILTDGWYSLPGVVDPPLKHMLKNGKISVGTKLLVSGAELLGMCEPCHPLEAPSSCCLKISSNSTRRARWFARLGYQPLPHPFPVSLESVYPEGGVVSCTHAVIARVYPMVYLEKKEGSRNVFRNEKMELKIATRHESERQKMVDRICSRVQREFEEELAKRDSNSSTSSSKGRRSRRLNALQIKQLQDGEDIYNALTNAADPTAFQGMLSHTQLVLLESYRQCLLSQRQDELQQRIKQAVQEAEDQLPPARNVVPLLKLRLVPLNGGLQSRPVLDCHLSIWRPNDAVKEILKEGTGYRLSNITANPSKYKGNNQRIQLTATRSTQYHPLNIPIDEHFSTFIPRQHTPISQLLNTSEVAYGEVDTVGIVVCVTSGHVPSHDLERPDRTTVDTFYLANHDGSLLEVKVWDGLKTYGLEETIKAGNSLALSNLSYRRIGHSHQVPIATAGDITTISQQPRQAHLRDALKELNAELPKGRDRSTFLQTLEDEISLYL